MLILRAGHIVRLYVCRWSRRDPLPWLETDTVAGIQGCNDVKVGVRIVWRNGIFSILQSRGRDGKPR